MPDLSTLLPRVKQAALEAVKSVAPQEDLESRRKGENDFVTRVDIQISEFLCNQLPGLLPDSQVISEEKKAQDTGAPYHWIIDPIDGTNNLVYGLPLYAVSIGLEMEQSPLLGVVYLPMTGELFSSAKGSGAFLGNRPIHVNHTKSLKNALVMAETDPYFDRERNLSPQLIGQVFRRSLDCRITGSAAIDLCFIAAGRAGAHFCQHLNPWDYAGGSAILLEAGGKITQWDGSPVPYRGKHSSLATNGFLHEEMLEIIDNFLNNDLKRPLG